MVNPTDKAGLGRRSGDGSAVRAVERNALPLSSFLAMALVCLQSFPEKDVKGIRFRRNSLTNLPIGYSSGVGHCRGSRCRLRWDVQAVVHRARVETLRQLRQRLGYV